MSLTISAASVDALIANPTSIFGYSSSGPIIISGAISHTQASNLNAVDASYIDATVSETSLSNLSSISVDNSTRTSLNKFKFSVSDTSSTAAALNAVQAKTSEAVNAAKITSISESPATDIQTLYTGTVPTGIGAVPITVKDPTVSATALEAINQFTTAAVISKATTVTGLAADVAPLLLLADGVVKIDGDVAVTLTDTTIEAANLNLVNGRTTGTVTSSATTITGTAGAVSTALTSNASTATDSIEGLDAVNAVLDSNLTTAGTQSTAVADVRTVIGKTTGKVTATITETDVFALVDTSNGVTGTGHSLTITINDPTATAAELNAIQATTNVKVKLAAPSKTGVSTFTLGGNAAQDRVDSTVWAEIRATGGSGSGATFRVETNGDGLISATLVNPGSGYAVGDVLTIPGAGTYTKATATGAAATQATATLTTALTPSAADSITISSSSYSDVLTLFQSSSSFEGLGAAPVTISGNISVGEANAIDALTTGAITATITDSSFSSLNSLTGTGNAYTVVVGDLTVSAADVNALVAKTSVAPDLNNVTKFTGSLTDLNTLYVTNHGNVTNTTKDEAVTVTDTSIDAALLSAVNKNTAAGGKGTSGLITLQNGTNIFGAGDQIVALYTANGTNQLTGLSNSYTATVKGTSTSEATLKVIAAADLKAIHETHTNGNVTIDSSATSISGTYTDVTYALVQNKTRANEGDSTGVASPTLFGLNNLDVTVTVTGGGGGSGTGTANTLTLDQYKNIQNNYTTGVVTATIDDDAIADILKETVTGTKDLVSGNAFSVKVTDTNFAAADLITLNNMTSGLIDVDSNGDGTAPILAGTSADLGQVFAAKVASGNGIKGIGDAAVNLASTDTSVSAADLHTIVDGTSGTTTITNVIRITGLLSDVKGIYDAHAKITGEGNEAITLTDATIDASVFKTLIPNGAATPTSGSITLMGSAISGTYADLDKLFIEDIDGAGGGGLIKQHELDDGAGKVIGADSINITATDTLDAAKARALTGATTGTVTGTISGSTLTALTATTGLNEAIDADTGFAGHNFAITISDAEVTAAGLKKLATMTKGTIALDTSSATGIQSPGLSGSIADINAVYADSSISGLGKSAITVTGGATVAQLNALTTTGSITAQVTDTSAANLANLNSNITAATLTLSDTTISATALDALDLQTTGQLNVSATTTLTGTYDEVKATLAKTATITGVDKMKVEVTGGSLTVAKANEIDGLTDGKVKATIVEKDLATLKTLGTGNSWVTEVDRQILDNPTTTNDETVLKLVAADLVTLEGRTDQVITVTAPSIEGSHADLVALFDKNTPKDSSGNVDLSTRTISGLETKLVTISDDITQAEAVAFQDNTTGVITANIGLNDFLTAVTGTINNGTHNTIANIDEISAPAGNRSLGVYTVEDTAKTGSGDLSTNNGSGAKFKITIADGGIADLDIDGLTAAQAGTDDVAGRIAGTYYITDATPGIAVNAVAAGNALNTNAKGYRLAVVVASNRTITVAQSFIEAGGTGFVDNDLITIPGSIFGGTTDVKLRVKGLQSKSIQIEQLAAGTGYTVNDRFTIPAATVKDNGTTETLGTDLTFDVQAIGNVRSTSTGQNDNTYTFNSGYTSSSGGTGATLNVAVDADGYATAVTGSGGEGFVVGSTITVPDSLLGGGGAGALTFAVTTVGEHSMTGIITKATTGAYSLKPGNNYNITIEDTALNAADILAAKSLTTGLVTLNSVTKITGTLADIKSIYAQEKTANGTTGITGIAATALDIRGDVGLISAADLKALDAETTGTITITPEASTITGISGSYADVKAVLTQDKHVNNATNDPTGVTAPTITGLLKSATAIAGIDNETGLGATPNRVDSTTFAELSSVDTTGTGFGATFKVVTAADGSATVTLVNPGAGYADNSTLKIPRAGSYGGATDITVRTNNLTTNPAMTVTLTGEATVAQVNDIIDNYSSLGKLEEGAAQGGIGVVTATLKETTMAALANLNTSGVAAFDGATGTGDTADRTDSTIFHDVAQASSTGSGTGATFKVTTDGNGAATVELVNRGTGYVDNEVITLNDSGFNAAGATTAITVRVNGLQNTAAKLSASITDTTVAAAALNTLDSKTTGTITLASGTTLTGALTTTATDDVNKALASTGITGIGAVAVKSTDANNTIEEANYVSAATTGVVTAAITKSTGAFYSLTDLAALTDSGNAFTITVSDTGTVDAAALNVLNGKTTGVITLGASKVSGAISDIKTLYDANTAGEVAGLGNEVVSISDTGAVNAATLNGVNSLTTGVVTATEVTTVTGTLTEIKAAYAAGKAGTISGLGDEAISISDLGTVVTSSDLAEIKALTTGTVTVSLSGTSVTATSLNSLDTSSTQTVNAAGVTEITGSAADVNTVYAAGKAGTISGLGDEAVTLTDTSIKASTLNTVDGNTNGSVAAAGVTTITGSAADVNSAYAASGITGLGNEAVTLSDTSASASVLNTIDGKTTGKIDASTLTKLTGTSADVKTAFESAGISGLTFDASNYLASYTDLLAAYGTDLASARAHYFAFGAEEGRSFDAFDETSYLASYSDLLGAFGTNVDAALVHYINNGYSEGRVADAFDENSYLASNTSLIGTVTDAAAHYVSTGYAAGLALDSFDENSYLASNTSLIGTVTDATAHYVNTGYAAGLAADSFDELGYIASHSDLIAAYGVDGAAGTQHFISFGSTEGRSVTFDAASYLAAHADLRAAYGTDQELAKQHYITFGSAEGRATA